ncbi:MAG: sigma-70 family RNA polymerase sigma factor [Actinomycetota bacterium]|nr:sigma-70 family RNA polymerase sigma factor [Actinomycetota bacterium]
MTRPSRIRDDIVSDVALVLAIADGQHAALAELYARYGRIVFSLARRIIVDSGLAEDVTQEVFLALWRDPGKFDPDRGAFGTWLLSLTHHRSVDAIRREEAVRRRRTRAVQQGESLALTDAPLPVADEAIGGVRRDRVRRALRSLPAPQREALTLAYFGGYTQREVAAITGAPLGTVKTRMLAGMRSLRADLAADVGTPGDLL